MVRRHPLGQAVGLLTALLLVLVFGRIIIRPASAQTPTNLWREPTLIAPNTGSQWSAQIAGDAAGQIYVVWPGYSVFAQANAGEDALFYRAWDGVAWSEPIDILAVAQGDRLLLDRFVIDRFGRLLILWHTGRELFLSSAWPSEAQSAVGWQTVRLRAGEQVWGADLALGADGTIDVIFAGEGQDIAYLRTIDLGATWTEPAAVSLGDDPQLQVQYPALALSSDGVLHASWTLHEGQYNWVGSHVYYSRSTNNGTSWSEPFPLVERVGHGASSVAADGQGHVWVFWNRSAGSRDGRYYAYSEDSGLTWQTPIVAFYDISGFTRQGDFVWDSNGDLRLFFAGQGLSGTEVWQTVWQGAGWSAALPVQVGGVGTGSEVFQASVAGGDTLLVAWTDYYTDDIWLTSQKIAAPLARDEWLPTPTPMPTLAPPHAPTSVPSPAPNTLLSAESFSPPRAGLTTSPSFPLLMAALAVVFITIALLLARELLS